MTAISGMPHSHNFYEPYSIQSADKCEQHLNCEKMFPLKSNVSDQSLQESNQLGISPQLLTQEVTGMILSSVASDVSLFTLNTMIQQAMEGAQSLDTQNLATTYIAIGNLCSSIESSAFALLHPTEGLAKNASHNIDAFGPPGISV